MSKVTMIDNDLLKSEIRALNNYVNRDEYNLNVVEVMVNEIQDIVKGLKPCIKAEGTINHHTATCTAICPHCGSNNVQLMYGTSFARQTPTKNEVHCHYICEDCHKEFDI